LEQLLFSSPGGTGRYTATLAAMLSRLSPADDVIPFFAWHSPAHIQAAYRRFGLDREALEDAVRLPLPRPVLYDAWLRLSAPRLDRWSSALASAEIIHAPSPAVPPKDRRPLVVTVHDAAFKLFPDVYPRRGRRFHELGVDAAARRADFVIVPSRASADEIVALTAISEEQIRVVPHGVDRTVATPDEMERTLDRYSLTGRPYVLWVGSLEPRKGVGTLIAAFARLQNEGDGPPPALVLVGPGGWLHGGAIEESDVEALGDRLRILGTVDEDALRALYAAAVLFAFPSLHEGFGLPVLEAMIQGTAVLCSDLPALREVAGAAARFVPAGDRTAWTAALDDLLTRPAERAGLADAGRSRATGFTWEQTIVNTRAVYHEALGSA